MGPARLLGACLGCLSPLKLGHQVAEHWATWVVILWLRTALTGQARRYMEGVPMCERLCLGGMEGRSMGHLLLGMSLPVLLPVRLGSWLSLAGVLRRLRSCLIILGLSSVSA